MQYAFELSFSDKPLPERVIVLEELSDPYSLHDDFTLDFFFDLVEVLIIFLKLFRGEQCGDQVKPFPIVHVVLVRV